MSGQNRVFDRVQSFLGGMNAFNYPADLPLNQNQLLQNMIVLDSGRAVTRPGANKIDSNPSTFTNINPTGIVQGLAFLDNFTYGQFIVLAEGGKMYQWNGATWSNALAFTLTSVNASVAMCQGQDQMLISDGVKGMQLYNGNAFTPCSGGATDTSSTNAPTGATCMAYIAGMFVVAGPACIMGNGSGGTTTYPPDTVFFSNYLQAGEGQWNITQSFRVGNGDGEPIVGLAPIQNTASTYPIYNLAVLKSNSIWIVAITPGAYSTFADMFAAFTAAPQGDQVGSGIGCVGSKAFCLYQNDLLFMSTYGVQSLQRMQAAAGQYQLTSPLSQPIQPYIDRINWDMAYNIQAVKYKQYAIFFVPLDDSLVNNYALVWDGFLGQWMIWYGWTPECAVVTRFNNQIALVTGDSAGLVNQWQDADQYYGEDSTYYDNGVPVAWELTTRSFTFKNLEALKKLKAVIVRFNGGNATINFAAYYDTSDNDNWQENISPTGATLPVILPFKLASQSTAICYRSELGNVYANEFWITIGAAAGFADIRNIVGIAYIKPIKDNTA